MTTPPRVPGTPRTVIVGGGLAGLAAAVTLAERGVGVIVLESRPRLGGRASSFVDKATGTQIDNCQHVSLGCCTNFQHFCRTVGLSDLFRTERELYFIGRDRLVNRLAAGPLPAPLHLAAAFARTSYLSRGDLLSIGRGMRALARRSYGRGDSRGEDFAAWLARHRQPHSAIERFWMPVLVSSLSETLDRIDVASARKVFVDAFLANRAGWQVQIPTVPLDALYGTRLTTWLAARGASVRLQAGVERLAIEEDRAVGAVLRTGETVEADHVIVAVPHWLALELLPAACASHPDLARLGELETAPISSVHLWFDRPILFPPDRHGAASGARAELPHAVLIDRLSQWIFNRDLLHSRDTSDLLPTSEAHSPATAKPGKEHGYQVVISASRNIASNTQQEVIAQVAAELADVFPEAGRATLLHARLVTEHRAVFSVRPGAESCRPPQQSPLANVQLAGDWTRTGWPSTMEGAVRSGFLAAENVLRRLGRPETLVQPDLPVSPLSRLLLGL